PPSRKLDFLDPTKGPSSLLEGGALDLHVLSLPPAFVLSQDQTLKLRHPILAYGHVWIDENITPKHSSAKHQNAKRNISLETCPPKSRMVPFSPEGHPKTASLCRPRFSFFFFNCQRTGQLALPSHPYRGDKETSRFSPRKDRFVGGDCG